MPISTRWTLAVTGALALMAAAGHAQAPHHSSSGVVMLGTGNPIPDPDRFGPATAVIADRAAYLVDAGDGVMRRWRAAQSRHLVDDVRLRRVVFITHLHSDHTQGLPELIWWLWMTDQDDPITIYGPHGTKAMIEHILAAWSEDIAIRTGDKGEFAGKPGPQVDVHEIESGVVYQDSVVAVTAFAVHHGTWPQALGYRFNTPDKVIVISGDAAPPSAIPEQCQHCDILVHEGGLPGAKATPYYHEFHSIAEEIARVANAAQPRLLVLTHQRPGVNQAGLDIIRARYDGRVVIAGDLDVFH
ncbi:MAG TPA: MBL fold metallo-hydrolase [Gemmatimonadales bacterium]|nr:MBL fold metallo-hydrolase [Gemmatimonadales bacterium]